MLSLTSETMNFSPFTSMYLFIYLVFICVFACLFVCLFIQFFFIIFSPLASRLYVFTFPWLTLLASSRFFLGGSFTVHCTQGIIQGPDYKKSGNRRRLHSGYSGTEPEGRKNTRASAKIACHVET